VTKLREFVGLSAVGDGDVFDNVQGLRSERLLLSGMRWKGEVKVKSLGHRALRPSRTLAFIRKKVVILRARRGHVTAPFALNSLGRPSRFVDAPSGTIYNRIKRVTNAIACITHLPSHLSPKFLQLPL
jgi:hypothetical protein